MSRPHSGVDGLKAGKWTGSLGSRPGPRVRVLWVTARSQPSFGGQRISRPASKFKRAVLVIYKSQHIIIMNTHKGTPVIQTLSMSDCSPQCLWTRCMISDGGRYNNSITSR